jgi:hypothetical protein
MPLHQFFKIFFMDKVTSITLPRKRHWSPDAKKKKYGNSNFRWCAIQWTMVEKLMKRHDPLNERDTSGDNSAMLYPNMK